MAEQISSTAFADAPLSSAKNPDPSGADALRLDASKGNVLIGRTVTINRPRTELYTFWRNFQNLPLFMENIESVKVLDSTRSHWVVCAPAQQTVEWDSIITEEIPGSAIAWTSAPDAGVRHSGRIEFRDAPAGRGTEVTATIIYDPPAGAVGKLIAKLFQREPAIQARRDLRRFKQLMETGEISTAEPPDAAPRA
jgi:uncharacterized membrane protein